MATVNSPGSVRYGHQLAVAEIRVSRRDEVSVLMLCRIKHLITTPFPLVSNFL